MRTLILDVCIIVLVIVLSSLFGEALYRMTLPSVQEIMQEQQP